MHKLLFAFLLLPVFTFSQITITQSDMPSSGNTFINTNALVDLSIDVNETGANHSWDYSGVQPLYSSPDTFGSVSDLPVLVQLFFFFSNLVDKNGISLNFNGFTLQDVYTVFTKNSTQLQIDGYSGSIDGIPLPMVYSSKDILYRFPLNFGNTDSSDASLTFDVPGLAYISQQRHRVNEVDGWGTIQTPIGIFNALRVKSTITDVDSVFIDTLNFGSMLNVKSYEYKWLAQGSGIPVFQLNAQDVLGTPLLTGIIYQDTTFHSGIVNVSLNTSAQVFPNPASSVLQISFNEHHPSNISVSDVLGRKLLEGANPESTYLLNVEGWNNGIYFIRGIQNGKSFSTSFLVNH